jgi:hypothetical protein
MYKWKQFIKGPGLHEELRSYGNPDTGEGSSSSTQARPCLAGEKAKEIYEKIVSEPSELDVEAGLNTYPGAGVSYCNVEQSKPKPKKLTLTQLMRFCESNNIEELSRYIESYHTELDINEKDQYGWTLLMSAACSGSFDCVELLLRAGSDWTLTDKGGLTAFHLAQKKHRSNICELIGDWVRLRRSEADTSSEGSESEDDAGDSGVKFCESCNINYTNEKEHSKSIAHLVCSSTYPPEDRVHYGIPESNKGFQLMLRTGCKRRGLGAAEEGQKFPVKTVLKRDRKGLGQEGKDGERKSAKITHFAPFDTAAVEGQKRDERLERLGTVKRKELEKQRNKQKVKEIKYRRELGSI